MVIVECKQPALKIVGLLLLLLAVAQIDALPPFDLRQKTTLAVRISTMMMMMMMMLKLSSTNV